MFPGFKLFSQSKEMMEIWQNKMDSGKINFRKPSYLTVTEEQMLNLFDKQPNFGMYKDNYIVTGIPINREISKYTADVKFQISVYQRLTKGVLPFNSSLMLTYTQKSFWNVYKKSAPFEDSNYNPGLLLAKPVIYKNQLRGVACIALEHESNGKDSLDSRGWEYLVLSGLYFFNPNFTVQAKIWAGFLDHGDPDLDGGGNPDFYKYRGFGLIAMNYRSLNDKFWVSAIINPRKKLGNFNTQLELNIKLNAKTNQYFFIQWYSGYCENMLNYNKHTSMVRAGICIKPPLRNLY
jgi:phospholipase A1